MIYMKETKLYFCIYCKLYSCVLVYILYNLEVVILDIHVQYFVSVSTQGIVNILLVTYFFIYILCI